MNKKKILLIFLLLFILTAYSFFLFRNVLLQSVLNKLQTKMTAHELNLNIGQAGFTGISEIIIENITVDPIEGSQLVSCKKISCSLSFLQLIKGNYPISNLKVQHGNIHFEELPDSSKNYTAFVHWNKKPKVSVEQSGRSNFVSMFNSLWKNFSALSNIDVLVEDFIFSNSTPKSADRLMVKSLSIENSGFNLEAIDLSNKSNSIIRVIGTVNPGKGLVEFHGSSPDNSEINFPFVENFLGLKVFSNTFGGKLQLLNQSTNKISLNINAAVNHPGINHWRIGPEDVILDSIGVNLNMTIIPETISIDTTSFVIINKLPITFNVGYTRSDSTRIKLNASFKNVDANDFFQSLPQGLFYSVKGIKTEGKLSYNLLFDVTTQHPDDLIFKSELNKDKFKISNYGIENLSSINQDFIYEAREDDKLMRTIHVSNENSSFTPLGNISPLLINCVLISEDGTYFYHKGFNEEAFRVSMATNIKEKRFARGGSTITMQLVKNIFLSRNKTISRKVEEALIVWLIENQHIVSKERMLEVYLNIIEWGPNIYGIGEASEFYFNKKPAELSMSECIFLSSIIPRPKYFKYSFNADGSLKDYLKSYFDVVAGRLLKKEIINQETFEKLNYQVELKGRALQFVLPTDTVPSDTLIIDNAGELF